MKRQIFKSIITLACGVMLTQVAMSQAFVPKDAEIALPARSAKLEANVMDVYANRASAAGADFKGQALSEPAAGGRPPVVRLRGEPERWGQAHRPLHHE